MVVDYFFGRALRRRSVKPITVTVMYGAGVLLLLIVCTTHNPCQSVPAEVVEEDTGACLVRFGDAATGEGVYNKTFNNVPYCAFLGIRYAKPPSSISNPKAP